MHRLVEDNGVLDTCRELGIGFVPYSPINRGFLGGCINEYTVFDSNNDNRQTLPRFQPEAMRANMRIVNALQAFGRTRGHDFGTGGTRLVVAESAVDRTDSRNDEIVALGRKSANVGICPFARRVERTGSGSCYHSGGGRPL